MTPEIKNQCLKVVRFHWHLQLYVSSYGRPQAARPIDPLLFPKDNFTVETKMVKTSTGEKKITYHSYLHIPYVANPIDKDYQSMNVSVPVKVDDAAVDAANAPILFVIGVGGYMSVNNARTVTGNSRAAMLIWLWQQVMW